MTKRLLPLALVLLSLHATSSMLPAQEEEGKAETEQITISARDMQIRDFFGLLNRQYGLNIVVAKGVQGKISVHLEDVPYLEALDCITKANGLTYGVFGDITLIELAGEGSSRSIEPPGQVEIEPADPAVETAGPAASNDVESAPPEDPVAFQAFPLMFLEASHAVTLIEPLLTPGVGVVKGVDEGNLLVVRDRAATLAQVAKVLAELDGESRQIRISVKIVIINRTDIDSAGFDWMTRFRASGASKPITFPFNKRHQAGSFFPENDPFGEDEESGADFPLNGSFPYAEKGDFAFGTLSAAEFSLLIEFLNTTSDTELVSEPEITTVNNKTAKIINGNIVQVPIYSQNLQYGITSVTGYQEIETGTNLEITPRILDETAVILKVKPEVSEIIEYRGPNQEFPNVATRKAETEVILEDGKTLIIGGLVRTEKRERASGIPLLEDIPLLGALFRYTSEEQVKSDMIIFITPRLIDREALNREERGLKRHEGRWVHEECFERACQLEAALFSPSLERRRRGLELLAATTDEEVLFVLDPEAALVRVVENDAQPGQRALALSLLAHRYPEAFSGWLQSLVLTAPEAFDTAHLVSFALNENLRHLRDQALLAALLVARDGTRAHLIKHLEAGGAVERLRAAEGLWHCPSREARAALVSAFEAADLLEVRLYTLHSLSRCDRYAAAQRLQALFAGARPTPLGSATREALAATLEGESSEEGAGPTLESIFSRLVSETGSASPPRIVGSPEFHARVAAALDLIDERAPRHADLLGLTAEKICEAAAWRARGGLCRTIETNGAEVACWPPERIAYELLHFASRLYQQTILASTLPHELEASRDGFWAVLTLNRAPYPSEAYLAWFYRSLLLLEVPPSVEEWRNTLEPRHTELHIEAEKNAIMPAWTGLEIQR